MSAQPLIAWDFDGVLNANIRDGRFIWAEGFEEFTGQSRQVFNDSVFGPGIQAVITGQQDLRDRVSGWADKVGYKKGPDAILNYWFESDFWPDAEVLLLVDQISANGIRQVIATNNEHRRAARITEHPEFGARFEHIFASGRMKTCKLEPAFFEVVARGTGVAPEHLVLVDGSATDVAAARDSGWTAFHFADDTRAGVLDGLAKLCGVTS